MAAQSPRLRLREVSELTGLTRNAIRKRLKLRTFLPPSVVLETGQQLWDRAEVERWWGVAVTEDCSATQRVEG